MMWWDQMPWYYCFECYVLSQLPSFFFFTFIKRLFSSSLSALRVVSFAYLRLLIFLLAMAPHSSTLAWKIPWMEKPGGVHGVAKSRTWLSEFTFTFHFHALEKEMATHSSILAWRIPWMEEPGALQSTGLQRVRHDWATSLSLFQTAKGVCQGCILSPCLFIRRVHDEKHWTQ